MNFTFKPNKVQFVIDYKVNLEDAKFIILPIPYEHTTSYGRGTRKGPAAILNASTQLELWDEELKFEVYKTKIFTLDYFKYTQNERVFFNNIERYINKLLERYPDSFPVFIGGEHSITQGLIPPFKKKYPALSILHFDAHADLRGEYQNSIHSHACALFPASINSKVVQIGIRSVGVEEKNLINAKNVKTFLMHENLNIDKLKENILKELTNEVYITIDVDGFDPSIMPGTGTPQPGGFGWYDAIDIFRTVIYSKNVVGMDIVEVSPVRFSNITEFNAAKLIYRLIGYISKKKGYIP